MKFDNLEIFDSKYFLLSLEQKKIVKSLYKKPVYAGEYLGRLDRKTKKFFPSIVLIKKISEVCKRKVDLSTKGSFLFLCGRDIMSESILIYSEEIKKGDLVLVFDEKDDCIGYGEAITDLSKRKSGIVVRNKLDLGDFLRREMTKKK